MCFIENYFLNEFENKIIYDNFKELNNINFQFEFNFFHFLDSIILFLCNIQNDNYFNNRLDI